MQPSVRRRTFVSALAALGMTAGGTQHALADNNSQSIEPQWTATYGETPASFEDCIADGAGTVAAGVRGSAGWIVRLDEDGEIDWELEETPSEGQGGFEAVTSTSWGYVAAGVTEGDRRQGWLVAVDDSGDVRWQETIDEPDGAFSGVTTVGSTIAAVGRTTDDSEDGWLVTVEDDSTQQLSERYGPPSSSEFTAVTDDGGSLVVAGRVESGGGHDPWLLEIDPDNGEVENVPSVDGSGSTALTEIGQGSDSLVAVGTANGGTDGFLVRISGGSATDEVVFEDAQTLRAVSSADGDTVVGGASDEDSGIVAQVDRFSLDVRYSDEETSVVNALDGLTAVGRQNEDGGGIGSDSTTSSAASPAPSIVDDPVAWAVGLAVVDEEPVIADLAVRTDAPIPGEPVAFDATDSEPADDIDAYEWSFEGESFEPRGPEPEHTFEEAGEYEVSLRIRTVEGEEDETAVVVGVAESDELTADFELDPEVVVVDEEIQFDATASGPEEQIDAYEWDLEGDGEFDELGPTPTFVYEETQEVVTIELQVVGTDGERAFASEQIEVLEDDELTAVATASPTPQTVGETITFTATDSTPDPIIETYEWEWPNGDTETGSILSNLWFEPGTYEVTLRVEDEDGNTDEDTVEFEVLELDARLDVSDTEVEADERVTFDGSDSTPKERITEYEWDFDWDGEFSVEETGETTTHTYEDGGEYTATLRIRDDNGTERTAAETITVELPDLSADFSIDTDEPTVGDSIEFDGGDSGPESTIESYEWAFDAGSFDGGTATGEVVTHEYDSAGEYDVELTVTDEDGEEDEYTRTIEVKEPELEPAFDVTPQSPQVDDELEFDASESEPADEIESYEWAFDAGSFDGETGTGETVTHEYDSAGEYDVELTVTDDTGAEASTTETIEVGDGDAVARFTLDPSNPDTGEDIALNASDSEAEGTIEQYEWRHNRSFNVDAEGEEATLTFDDPGDVEITLRIETEAGTEDETSQTITVGDDDGGLGPPDDDEGSEPPGDDDDDGGLGPPEDDDGDDGEGSGEDDGDEDDQASPPDDSEDEEIEQVAMPDRLPAAAAASLLGGGLAMRAYRRLRGDDEADE